jgi:aldose 1-epimerase
VIRSSSPNTFEDGPLVILETGSSRAVFDRSDGFRLCSLVIADVGLIVTDQSHGTYWWGAFVMSPWTSELRRGEFSFDGQAYQVPLDSDESATHGVARKSVWDWDRSRGVASTKLEHGWPLGGSVSLRPRLTESGLDVDLTIAAGTVAMPAAIGWHPWFPITIGGVPGRLRIPSGALVQHRNPSGVPSGLWSTLTDGPLNDCLRTSGPIRIEWPGVGSAEVAYDAEFATIFNDNDHGICVEPVTSPAETMLRRLNPGESSTLHIKLSWTPAL